METRTNKKIQPNYYYKSDSIGISSKGSSKSPQSQLHCFQQHDFNGYKQGDLPFDFEFPIRFATQPLQAQAYLHYNQHNIINFFNQFTRTLKSQMVKEIERFQTETVTFLNRLFSYGKYNDIQLMSNLGFQMPTCLTNTKLLTSSLPKLKDYRMPSFKSLKRLILLIRKHLDQYLTLKTIQPNIKLQEQSDNNNNSNNNIINNQLLKKENNIQYDKIEIDELKHYIHEFNTLSTATSLMGDKIESFYSYDIVSKQTLIKCRHCQFEKSILSDQKSSSKAHCSKIILDHLLIDHPFISSYNYDHIITRRAVRQIKLSDIGQMAKAGHIQRVFVVDRSCSLYFYHAIKNSEPSVAVQVLYFGETSHSNCEFIRGGNSKQVLLLIGFLIQQIVVSLGKKITIYTNDSKCSIIDDFCKYYFINGVTTVTGKGRKQTREELNFFKLEEGQTKLESLPKIEDIFSNKNQRFPIPTGRGFLKIEEEDP